MALARSSPIRSFAAADSKRKQRQEMEMAQEDIAWRRRARRHGSLDRGARRGSRAGLQGDGGRRHPAHPGQPALGPDRAPRERARPEPAPGRRRRRRFSRRLVRPQQRSRPSMSRPAAATTPSGSIRSTAHSRPTKPTRIDGQSGDDTLIGGSGNESPRRRQRRRLRRRQRGRRYGLPRRGNDTFVWDPGDGSDVIEGGKRL